MFCLAEWIMAIPLDELTRSDGLAPTSLQCALTALDGVVKGTRSDGSVWSGGQIPTLAELFEKLKPKRSDNSSGSGGHKTGTSSVGHHIQSPPETPGGLKPRPPLNTSFSDPARNATLVSSDGRTQSGDGNTNKANPHTNIKLAAKAVRAIVISLFKIRNMGSKKSSGRFFLYPIVLFEMCLANLGLLYM